MYQRNTQKSPSRDFLSTSGNSFGRPRNFSRNNNSRGNFRRRPQQSRGRNGSGRGRGGRGNGGRGRFGKSEITHDKYVFKGEEPQQIKPYEASQQFNDFELDNMLKANIIKKGYFMPTQIQDMAIPHILEGKDIVGLASTGSGKTAAFLIPMINKVATQPNQKVLIITPTRELAQQINDEFYHFSKGMNQRSAVVIGGANMRSQIFLLNKNPQFVIGTPGRLKDLYNRRALNLGSFNNIILDEVDRMLDMGFVQDIKFLISKLREEKQTLFFSATMPKEARNVADSLLIDPVIVEVENEKTSKFIDQDIVRFETLEKKVEKLHDILIQEEVKKVLIFSQTKRGVDRLYYELRDRGFKVDAIHGDKTQNIRGKVIRKFKENEINVLIATDVAARGLDIPNVTHVINYDEPQNYNDYIHRIGRTGRAGKKGKALTFVR